MRALVAYGSANGSTKEIAEVLAVSIAESGPDVDLRSVEDVATLAGYDAVVLGSPVHNGAWLPEVHEFCRDQRLPLRQRRVWLFSVGAVGATTSAYGPRSSSVLRKLRREPRSVLELRRNLEPQDHHAFAGVLDADRWGRMASLNFRLLGGTWGDHRDWDDVRRWGATIGTALSQPGSSTGTTPG
ncbi:MAG TPA: flavodoxin domain-containing protein [Acidimicrobiales bacterium]